MYMHDTTAKCRMIAEQDIIEGYIVESCACQKVRVAARAVTRAYDDALRPVGLRATQLAVLVAVGIEGAVSITALAKLMGMDRSTLTRNLRPLEREGLVAVGLEGWRRSRTLEITNNGRTRLREALPPLEAGSGSARSRDILPVNTRSRGGFTTRSILVAGRVCSFSGNTPTVMLSWWSFRSPTGRSPAYRRG